MANPDLATTAAGSPVTLSVTGNDAPGTGNTLIPTTVQLIDPADNQPKTNVTTAQGTWTVNTTTGAVTFTPASGFTGTATLSYTVQDSGGGTSNQATITVIVSGGPTVARDDSGATAPATAITLPVLNNDEAGPERTLLPTTVQLIDPADNQPKTSVTTAQGAWTVNPTTGAVTFTPTSNYNGTGQPFTGTATLPYTVQDSGEDTSNQATITVIVNPTADPTANPDSASTTLNTAVNLTPANNDTASAGATLNPSTVDLDPATAGFQRGPITTAQGTWEVIDNAGTVTFTPATGFTGTATLDYAISDSLGHTATATMTVTVTPAATVDVYTTVSAPAGAPLNGVVNAILTYGNQGTAIASNVSYSVTLPAGLSGVSCSGATCSYNSSTGVVTVTGLPPSLSPGQTEQVVLSYTATISGALTVQSSISTTSTDSNTGNNTASASTQVPAAVADVAALVDAPTTATAGSTVQVDVSFLNLGTATATGVSYSLTLPAGLSNVSCSGATCSYDSGAGSVLVTGLPASLAAGQTANLTLSYTAPASGSVTVTATVNVGNDSNSGNNSASDNTTISSVSTANVTTTVTSPATAAPGGAVAVAVTFSNLGPAPAAGMSYRLSLSGAPTNVVVRYNGVVCNYDSGTGLVTGCGLPATLNPGATLNLTLNYTAPASGAVQVTSTVGTSTTESNTTNNTASVSTTITASNLFDPPSGRKTVNAAGLPVLQWRMVWINNGNQDALRVRVVDPIPAGTTYDGSLSCTPSGASTVTRCVYEPGQNQIVYEGSIAADPGAQDETTARNEVVIVFNSRLQQGVTSASNTGSANWDANNDGSVDNDIAGGQQPVATNSAAWRPIIDIPTLSPAALLALLALLLMLGWAYLGQTGQVGRMRK